MTNTKLVILLTALLLVISFWLCLLINIPPQVLQQGAESIWLAIERFSIGAILLLGLALLGALGWLGWVGHSRGIIWHADARIRSAAADAAELQANLVITTVAPGSQVYATETGRLSLTHKPLYLAAGNVNGEIIEPTQEETRRWFAFNLLQNISHKPDVKQLDEMVTIQQALPDHVDLSHYLAGAPSLRAIFLGMGRFPDGQVKPVSAPLDRLVHIAEAGSSGFGKSTHMQALGYQCLNAREMVQVVMLDPQAVTFTPFAGDEHLKYPVASREVDILAILIDLVGEMERRQQLFALWRGVATLAQYNQVVIEAERLPQVPVFFDEFGLVSGDKAIAAQVKRLSQGGRKSGISLICGAQTWGADDIATSLRANLSTSIQFYARDKNQSRTLLGDSAAAEITRPGQAFCRLPGQPGLVELQAPDPSSLITAAPVLLTAGDEALMPVMPKVKPTLTPKDIEFIRLIKEGFNKSDACWEVYQRTFSGTFAQKLNRILSSSSFKGDLGAEEDPPEEEEG